MIIINQIFNWAICICYVLPKEQITIPNDNKFSCINDPLLHTTASASSQVLKEGRGKGMTLALLWKIRSFAFFRVFHFHSMETTEREVRIFNFLIWNSFFTTHISTVLNTVILRTMLLCVGNYFDYVLKPRELSETTQAIY